VNKNDIIEINGRRYDAKSGLPLLTEPASPKKTTPIHTHASPANHKPTVHLRVADRPKINPAAAHKPTASKLLMRQAVKKPGPSLRRQTRVQVVLKDKGRLESPISRVVYAQNRSTRALHTPKSDAVKHFVALQPSHHYAVASQALKSMPSISHQTVQPIPIKQPAQPRTTAEILERAIREANSHEEPLFPKTSHYRKRPRLFAKLRAA
jgi:hypothetical protein